MNKTLHKLNKTQSQLDNINNEIQLNLNCMKMNKSKYGDKLPKNVKNNYLNEFEKLHIVKDNLLKHRANFKLSLRVESINYLYKYINIVTPKVLKY